MAAEISLCVMPSKTRVRWRGAAFREGNSSARGLFRSPGLIHRALGVRPDNSGRRKDQNRPRILAAALLFPFQAEESRARFRATVNSQGSSGAARRLIAFRVSPELKNTSCTISSAEAGCCEIRKTSEYKGGRSGHRGFSSARESRWRTRSISDASVGSFPSGQVCTTASSKIAFLSAPLSYGGSGRMDEIGAPYSKTASSYYGPELNEGDPPSGVVQVDLIRVF